jgi:hypothetical protein
VPRKPPVDFTLAQLDQSLSERAEDDDRRLQPDVLDEIEASMWRRSAQAQAERESRAGRAPGLLTSGWRRAVSRSNKSVPSMR